jgi:hypothetical protein
VSPYLVYMLIAGGFGAGVLFCVMLAEDDKERWLTWPRLVAVLVFGFSVGILLAPMMVVVGFLDIREKAKEGKPA